MSKPREVIARAIYGSFCERELEKFDYHYDSFDDLTYPIRDNYLIQADAVIGALEGMEVTDKMAAAAFNWSQYDESVAILWRAMVGAMRSNE